MITERRTDDNLGDWYYNGNPYYQRGYGLPNCTCYAWGRLAEICNAAVTFYGGNAIMWASRPEMKQLPSPKVGSCIIYSGGITDSYGRLCGHIGVVEHCYDDGSIDVSMSSFGGYMWRIYNLKPNDGYHIPDSYNLTFYGFYMYDGVQAIYDQEARIQQEKKEAAYNQLQKSVELRSIQPVDDFLIPYYKNKEKVYINSIDALPMVICIVLLLLKKLLNFR